MDIFRADTPAVYLHFFLHDSQPTYKVNVAQLNLDAAALVLRCLSIGFCVFATRGCE